MSLAETLVALALMSGIGVVFLYSLSATTNSVTVVDERNAADSIAKSQMEYIINQPFSDNTWEYTVSASQRTSSTMPSWWDDDNPPLLDSDYNEYYAVLSAVDFDADGDSTIEVPGDDDSVREITINVYNSQDYLLFTLKAYKTNR